MPDDPSDRGFLLVDPAGRRILFEGLRERMRIPADALISCDVEGMLPTGLLYAVVVHTQTLNRGQGIELVATDLEVPFYPRPTTFDRYGKEQRRRLAEDLRDYIRSARPVKDQSDFEET